MVATFRRFAIVRIRRPGRFGRFVALVLFDALAIPGPQETRLAYAPAIGAVGPTVFAAFGHFVVVATRRLTFGLFDAGGVGPHFVLAADFALWAYIVGYAIIVTIPDESRSTLTFVVEARFVAFAWSLMLARGFAGAFASTIFLIGAATFLAMASGPAFVSLDAIADVVSDVARFAEAAFLTLEVAVSRLRIAAAGSAGIAAGAVDFVRLVAGAVR